MRSQELIDLEEQGWQALSSERDAAQAFYDAVLHDQAVMFFPGGMRVESKQLILESLAAKPWKTYQIEALRPIFLSEKAALLACKVRAQCDGDEPYEALISSTYTQVGGQWKLIFHQQTPV